GQKGRLVRWQDRETARGDSQGHRQEGATCGGGRTGLADRGAGGRHGGPGGGPALGGALSNALETEFEGMSAEDREFEVARRIVRVAGAAARNAAAAARE